MIGDDDERVLMDAEPNGRGAYDKILITAAVIGLCLLTACGRTESSTSDAIYATSAPEAGVADSAFAALEERFDARLGVYAVDTGTGREIEWRGDERFAYASTIKALAAGALLDNVGTAGLVKTVEVDASDIIKHSPVTETRVGQTMTLDEICEAALTRSDNAAANFIFAELGGPQAFDAQLDELGDTGTMVSRIEPDLNEALPGDLRDTTTPRASANNLREYVFGGALDDEEKTMLTDWMKASQTGGTLVRAQLPEDWTVGDKSGGGMYGSRGDLAVVWPTDGPPIVISVLSSRDERETDYDDRLIAGAAAAAVGQLR